ncbi:MerR family transcriptional regulator [Nocardia sp. NPDC101769]|uniref:MerR family transcriptional regulator n=1 Tax=Nocardia sp. NPDC101769 TaxID=3364333 RepID=UPI00381DD5E3
MTMPAAGLTIGQVATATGLSVHTLRFYEREGLFLHPPTRTAGGHRIYSPDDLQWLQLCNRLRDSGMPLIRIKDFADLIRTRPDDYSERLRMLREHEAAVIAKQQALAENLDAIRHKISIYEDHQRTGDTTQIYTDPRN